MDASRWKTLEKMVSDSLREPAGKRASFLEHSAIAAGFARAEVLEACAALLAVDLERTPDWGSAYATQDEPAQPPNGLEAFELIEELGSGGMGVVYRARQRGAVEREVAVKLCPAQPNPHLRQRLRQERRTLARLNHPNIAQMLEAGDTAAGQPYFVMELVAGGQPINDYCDTHRLGIASRLRLLMAVCAAVQYAHQQGVLHRDLKPANVLASGPSDAPQIKVIDFGIAKLLQEQVDSGAELGVDTPAADLTGLAILGTPNYMSPERLGLSTAVVDSRSDIYSLGIMLVELLIGEPPCSRRPGESMVDYRLRRGRNTLPTLDAMWDRLDGERRAQLAKARSQSSDQSRRMARSDLRWIVAKALAEDPTERYAAASELAADLSRHLQRRPVLAAPGSLGYQLGLLIRRRRWPVLIGTAAIGALLVAFWLRGVEAERANIAATNALQSQAETEQALRFLSNLFVAADPNEHLGQPADAGELLRRGVQQLADGELKDAPLVRARLLHTIAQVQWRRGDPQTAVELAAQALSLREAAAPDDLALRADSLHLTGTLYSEVDKYPLAAQMLDEALRLRQAVHGEASQQAMSTLNNIGAIREETGDYAGALETYGRMLALLASGGAERELEYARTLTNQGVALRRVRRFSEAEAAHREALQIQQRRLDPAHPDIALNWNNLGDLASVQKRYEDALTAFGEAEQRYRSVVGDQHFDLARTLNGKGNAYLSLGQWEQADTHFLQALAIYDHHASSAAGYPLANLALVALALHDWPLLSQRSAAFLERFPDDFRDRERWAEMRCLNARHRSDPAALTRIDQSLEIIGDDGEALGSYSRSRCLQAALAVADRIGDTQRAQQLVRALTQLAADHDLRLVGFELRLREAQLAAAAGDSSQASQLVQALLRDWPADAIADDGIVREAQSLLAALTAESER